MKYPLVGLCIAFCLGIIIAAYLKIPFLVLCLVVFLFLILGIIFIKQNSKFTIFILCAVFFLGAALLRNSQILSNCYIAKLIPYKSDSVFLIGVIDNDPIYQGEKVSFILKAEKLRINETWLKTCGKVLVKVHKKNNFAYGDRLFLLGKLYRPFSFSKGEFNYRNYLRHQGIYLILSVKKGNMVKQLDKNVGNPLKSFAFRIKHKMRDVIVKNLSPFSAGILNAIILGERQNLSAHTRDVLVYSGTVHIIAISGLHLAIVVFIILLILKIIKVPRKPRYILTILLLIIYCMLTGVNTPVVRATVMAIIFLLSYFLERKVNIYNSLSLAALIILAVNPWQLFEVSFQLSFLSVVSIVWLSPKIKSIFPEKLNKIPWIRFLISVFSVSFAAWLGLLPLIAHYFRILSPITILANMIIVPYMTIIVASGFSLALIGILIPSLTSIFAASNELFILILFKINSFLIAIPGAYFKLPSISFAYVLLYYVLLISVFNFSKPAGVPRL
ncbi:ComEC family competence protein [bacterium]|nr:MAG: ComEC family competence protein [bacterium]